MQLGVIDVDCKLVDRLGLQDQLRTLKAIDVDGIMVDCWWGIVEKEAPQRYVWDAYKELFQMVRDLKLKIQVGGSNKNGVVVNAYLVPS